MNLVKGIGKVAFVVGIVGALLAGTLAGFGVVQTAGWVLWTLIAAGTLIGLLNITEKESALLMISTLVVGSGSLILGSLPMVGAFIGALMTSVGALVLPAAIVIALKTIYKLAS